MARIDDKLFDRYLLTGWCPLGTTRTQPENDSGIQKKLCMEIEANKSGELYLYDNDAVLFTPHMFINFYDNNNGYAWVKITKLIKAGGGK